MQFFTKIIKMSKKIFFLNLVRENLVHIHYLKYQSQKFNIYSFVILYSCIFRSSYSLKYLINR